MTPDELRTTRARLGLSLTGLAEALGVDRMTVWRWEQGRFALPTWLPLALAELERRKATAA